ncbi:MAG: sortase [Ilumatobacteraceae bacterium]
MKSRRSIALLALVTVPLAACNSSSSSSAEAPTSIEAPTTAAPSTAAPTTAAPTTAAPTTSTTAAPTTIESLMADTTVADTLPRPENVPPPNSSVPLNQIGTMEIPKIAITKPMFEGVTMPTLDKGPGHWPGTAMPGKLGNVVVAGHRVSHDHPFRDLHKLKPGDEIVYNIDGGRYVYLVRETKIVYPDALWIVEQTPEKTTTLFACHPKGSTKQRIVVFGDYAPDLSTPAA